MRYEIFEQLCWQWGKKPADVSRETGISNATFAGWKTGRNIPRLDTLERVADYFDVPVDVFVKDRLPVPGIPGGADTGTLLLATHIAEREDLRVLMLVAMQCKTELVQKVIGLLETMI